MSRGDKFFNMTVYFARVVQKIPIIALLFLTCTDMKSSDYLYLKRQNNQMIHYSLAYYQLQEWNYQMF